MSNECEKCTNDAIFRALLEIYFKASDTAFGRSYIYRPRNDENGDKIIVLNCLEARGYVNKVINFHGETEYTLTDKGLNVYGIDPKPVPKNVQVSDSDMLENLSLSDVGDTLRIGTYDDHEHDNECADIEGEPTCSQCTDCYYRT